MIPEGWELVQANDVCHNISVGVVIKPSQYYVDESRGIKAFRSANVREGVINNSDWVYFSKEGHETNKKSHLKEGDVLIVRTGYPGTACVVTKEFAGSNAIDIVIARPNTDKVLPHYLCSYTNSWIGKAQVLNLQGGMAQKHLNVGAYKVLNIKLPPISEQTKISNILSTWDKAIKTVEKLIDNNRAQKKALMQQLLTGKKRLSGYTEKWQEVKISSIANITMGSSPKSDSYNNNKEGLPLLQGNADIKNRESAPRIYTSQITKTCNIGDTLLSVRAPVGEVAISQHHACIGRGIASLSAKPNSYTPFIYQLLIYKERHWLRLSQGSTFDCVNSKDIKNLHIFSPKSRGEKVKITNALEKQDQITQNLIGQLNLLKQQKNSLMQQLLTGKRRVKIDNDTTQTAKG